MSNSQYMNIIASNSKIMKRFHVDIKWNSCCILLCRVISTAKTPDNILNLCEKSSYDLRTENSKTIH